MACGSPQPVPPRFVPPEPAPGARQSAGEPATDDGGPDAGGEPSLYARRGAQARRRRQDALHAGGSSGSAMDIEWERGGGSGGDGWVKRLPAMVPVVAVAGVAALLVRAAIKGRRGGGRRSSESPAPTAAAGSERPRRPRGARKSGGAPVGPRLGGEAASDSAAEAAAAPPPEPAEPPPATLDAYASAFAEAPAAPGGALQPLAGLRLAVSEHIAVQVWAVCLQAGSAPAACSRSCLQLLAGRECTVLAGTACCVPYSHC
jgi:hypothetical protein